MLYYDIAVDMAMGKMDVAKMAVNCLEWLQKWRRQWRERKRMRERQKE